MPGGAQPERQQRQGDEGDRDREIELQARQAPVDVLRLVEAALEPDVRGQARLELRQALVDGVAHVEDVQVVLHARRHEHRALAVEAAEVALLLGAPADLGEVAQAHDALAAAR